MSCTICKTNPVFDRYGDTTYTICANCYEGAKNIIKLINKFETEDENANASTSTPPTNSRKSLSDASKWVMGGTEKLSFLHGLVDVYRNQTPSDILLKPSNNGSPITGHRALLAARSKVFKNMLESNTCETPPLETITLSELNHEELEALLEFLYSGSIPPQKLEKYIYPLSLASHKYEITPLQKFIQNYMLETLNSSNALLFLEISDFCSFLTTRDDTLSFIVKHVDDIAFSDEYEAFNVKNPHLSLQITRALSVKARRWMHAQFLTFDVLSVAAIFYYYEKCASQQAETNSLEASE